MGDNGGITQTFEDCKAVKQVETKIKNILCRNVYMHQNMVLKAVTVKKPVCCESLNAPRLP